MQFNFYRTGSKQVDTFRSLPGTRMMLPRRSWLERHHKWRHQMRISLDEAYAATQLEAAIVQLEFGQASMHVFAEECCHLKDA